MKNKKIIALIAAVLVAAFAFVSCGAPEPAPVADDTIVEEPADQEDVEEAPKSEEPTAEDANELADEPVEEPTEDAQEEIEQAALPMSVKLAGQVTEIRQDDAIESDEADADIAEDTDADAEVADTETETTEAADAETVEEAPETDADSMIDVLMQIRVEQVAADEAAMDADAETAEEAPEEGMEEAPEEAADAETVAEDTDAEIAAAEDTINEEMAEQAVYSDIVANITADTLVIDAQTGEQIDIAEIAEGDSVVLYTSSVMTFSQPPISNAYAVVVNLPEDDAAMVPEFIIASEVTEKEDGSVSILNQNGDLVVTLDENTELSIIDENGELHSINAADVREGSVLVIWTSMVAESMPAQAVADKAIVYVGDRASWNLLNDLNIDSMEDVLALATDADAANATDENADADADATDQETDADADQEQPTEQEAGADDTDAEVDAE